MRIEKYAVIGNPIAHSKSPLIHQAFASQFGKQISYEKVLAPLDGFIATIERLQAEGYRGANVTVPFKFEALQYVVQHGRLRPLADTARAVNTLVFNRHTAEGDNTDGVGLMRDIEKNAGVALKDKHVLIIGAGGAAFGILQPLVNAQPSSIVITNRTFSKAEEAATILATLIKNAPVTTTIHALPMDTLAGNKFDVIINSTSAGLTDTMLPIPNDIFGQDCLAYDMMYGRETPFMQQARKAGANVVDGLGMLVEQAAEAFFIWHGLRPETSPVIATIRQQR